ncbi:MAG: type II toxin-antitoxin system YafQ family toxin [Sulfurimonas sp.]
MLSIKIEKSFKKDIDRDKKSGSYASEDFEILKNIIVQLQNQEEIDLKYRRHPLKGRMLGFESIHIRGNWILIFKVDDIFVYLAMLGKHTQVYKKF